MEKLIEEERFNIISDEDRRLLKEFVSRWGYFSANILKLQDYVEVVSEFMAKKQLL